MRSSTSRFQLTGLTGTTAYFFDGITLTGFARVAYLIGLTNAALLYALIPLALALALLTSLALGSLAEPHTAGRRVGGVTRALHRDTSAHSTSD